MKWMRVLTMMATAMSLTACVLFHPYKIPIQQGPLLTTEQIQQLKPGMTQDQVRYILGTPNILDPLHSNSWYYVYTNQENYLPRVEKQLKLTFDGKDQLVGMSSDYPPPQPLTYSPDSKKI